MFVDGDEEAVDCEVGAVNDNELREVARRIKELGITFAVTSVPGAALREPSPVDGIARVGREEGSYYEKGSDE